MRPTDKTRSEDLARRQGDHSTLYVSLELSRSSWLVTSLSPNSDKMSKHPIAAGDAPKQQIADVETERDVSIEADVDGRPSPVALLARLKAIGPQIGAVLYHEGLYRSFASRSLGRTSCDHNEITAIGRSGCMRLCVGQPA
jgi:transposase